MIFGQDVGPPGDATKRAARGCRRTLIWIHDRPNQSQNNLLVMSLVFTIRWSACWPSLGLLGLPLLVSALPALLDETTTALPPSASRHRGAPLLLLLVQARRARPIRGEVSQASQGQPCKQPMCFGGGAVSFFSGKCTSWKKVTCHLGIFGRFWLNVDLKMT